MLADRGYSAVEGFGALYEDAPTVEVLAKGLADTGLTMPTAHFGLDLLERDPKAVLALARQLGIERIYCPWIAPEDRPVDGQGWRALGARLDRTGAPLRAAGLGFGWHNHDFEFFPMADGTLPITALFEGGPSLEWEMDVAWIVKGGADPAVWIATEASRITAVHVKDIAPAGQNRDEDGWADAGHGTVEWPALMGVLRRAGVQHFILEHDNPSDHERFAARSLASVSVY